MPKKEEIGIKIDPAKVKRSKVVAEEAKRVESTSVSAGPVDKALELAFNPSRDKIREVTIIDRMQGRLLPLLDVINMAWAEVIEIATYRQDSKHYAEVYEREKPEPVNLMEEYMYRLAQWQKSVEGTNLGKITDIALAEMETKDEDEDIKDGFADPYAKD